jgi:hypothetical protein
MGHSIVQGGMPVTPPPSLSYPQLITQYIVCASRRYARELTLDTTADWTANQHAKHASYWDMALSVLKKNEVSQGLPINLGVSVCVCVCVCVCVGNT